jgi:hypothetical protein
MVSSDVALRRDPPRGGFRPIYDFLLAPDRRLILL